MSDAQQRRDDFYAVPKRHARRPRSWSQCLLDSLAPWLYFDNPGVILAFDFESLFGIVLAVRGAAEASRAARL